MKIDNEAIKKIAIYIKTTNIKLMIQILMKRFKFKNKR